jgi:hypothetical protein
MVEYNVLVNKFASTGEVNILNFISANLPEGWAPEIKFTVVSESSNITFKDFMDIYLYKCSPYDLPTPAMLFVADI